MTAGSRRSFIFALAAFLLAAGAHAQCNSTAYGSFTCHATGSNQVFSGAPGAINMSPNLSAGDDIYAVSNANSGTTITWTLPTGCGCTWSQVNSGVSNTSPYTDAHFKGTNCSAGACSFTLTPSATTAASTSAAIAISGSNHTFDGTNGGNIAAQGHITTPSTINSPVLASTTVSGDFGIAGFIDDTVSGDTWTCGTGYTQLFDSTVGIVFCGKVQTATGSISTSATSSNTAYMSSTMVALEPTGGGGAVLHNLTLLGVGR